MLKDLTSRLSLPALFLGASLSAYAAEYNLTDFPGSTIQGALDTIGSAPVGERHTLTIPAGDYSNQSNLLESIAGQNYPTIFVPERVNLVGDQVGISKIINTPIRLAGDNDVSNLSLTYDILDPSYAAVLVKGSNVSLVSNTIAGDNSTGRGIFSQDSGLTNILIESNDVSGTAVPISLNQETDNSVRRNHLHNNSYGFYTVGGMDFGTVDDPGENVIRMNGHFGYVNDLNNPVKSSSASLTSYAELNFFYDQNDVFVSDPNSVLEGITYIPPATAAKTGVIPQSSLVLTEVQQSPHPDYPGTQTSSVDNWMQYQ